MSCITGPPPDIEDPDLLCTGPTTPETEPIDPRSQPCPEYLNVGWPIECPTPRTYANMRTASEPIIDSINSYRTSRDMQPLVWNSNLTYAAQMHASYLYDTWEQRDPAVTIDFDLDTVPETYETLTHFQHVPHVQDRETLRQRTDEAGFLHGRITESLAGSKNGVGSPMDAYCAFKSEYTGDGNGDGDPGAFAPMTAGWDTGIQDLKYIGIGWKHGVFVYVYGGEQSTVIEEAPPIEDLDSEIQCGEAPLVPLIPTEEPCPPYSHPEWPVECPTPITYDLIERVCQPAVDETNRYRESRGMKPLIWDNHLAWAAMAQAWWNDDNGKGGHDSPGAFWGDNFSERIAYANYKNANGIRARFASEGAAGTANFQGGGPQGSNPMFAFCKFKNAWKCDEPVQECNSHFGPMTQNKTNVLEFRHIGMGWQGTKWVFIYARLYGPDEYAHPPHPLRDLYSINPDWACP